MAEDEWHVIGTTFNTSAADWLQFKISDPPNLKLVQSIRITDDDPAEDDHLEEVQLTDEAPEGRMFDYQIQTERSLKSGMAWSATTALGKAIFGGIALAVFLVVLSHLGAAI